MSEKIKGDNSVNTNTREIIEKLSAEERQSKNMLNGIVAEEKKGIYIRGLYDCNYEHAVNSGFFITKTKQRFDISIIVKGDINLESWIQINLTSIELKNLYLGLSDLQKKDLPYDIVTIQNYKHRNVMNVNSLLYQIAFDLYKIDKYNLLTFKNIKRSYNNKKFNFYWDGNGVIDLDVEPNPDWILLYN